MPEEHLLRTSTGATTDERNAKVMFDLYERVNASAIAKFALDGATTAVHNGTGYATPADQTFFENDGSYMVIEFEASYALDCQMKIRVDTTAEDLFIDYAPSGGFVGGVFPGNSTGDLTLLAAAPSATADFYFSIVDLDGYPYLRMLQYDAGWQESFRFGGYDAADSENTKPHMLLMGVPKATTNNSAGSWGYAVANASNVNRIPNEYVGDAGYPTAIAAGGYAFIYGAERLMVSNGGITPKGRTALCPIYVARISDLHYGKFGDKDMFGVDDTKADRDTDSAGTYIVVNDLMMRWNP